jgi:hypothetical protein
MENNAWWFWESGGKINLFKRGYSLIISLGGKNEKGFVGFVGWPVVR